MRKSVFCFRVSIVVLVHAAVLHLSIGSAVAQDAARGLEIFTELECVSCHGDNAQGQLGPALAGTKLRFADVRLQVRSPRTRRMPPFSTDKLPEEDLAHIYAYLQSLTPPGLQEKRTWWGIDLLNLPTPLPSRAGDFEVHFTHRFSDSIQDAGREGLYGLDSFAFPSFWFAYGITDRIATYFGRSSNLATWEYGVKVSLLPEGAIELPLSIAANVGGIYLDANGIETNSRFTAELPIGIRLGSRFAFQAVPFYTTNPDEQNLPDSPGYAVALGLGGSLRLSTTYSLEAEWITNLGGFQRPGSVDQWQAGVAIHINQHLFQLLFTNSIFTTPDSMASGTFKTGIKSNVRFGFNLVRIFGL